MARTTYPLARPMWYTTLGILGKTGKGVATVNMALAAIRALSTRLRQESPCHDSGVIDAKRGLARRQGVVPTRAKPKNKGILKAPHRPPLETSSMTSTAFPRCRGRVSQCGDTPSLRRWE